MTGGSVLVSPPGSIWQRAIKFLWNWINLIIHHSGPRAFYREFIQRPKKLNELPKRPGEVAVITGGARGIGFEVVKKLLQSDFHVIIGVRNVSAGEKAVQQIRDTGVATGSAKVLQLDLKSLKSVRSFATNVLKETDKIDLVINNAGVMFPPYEVTEDGYESQFQVNYLGHFLLTNLLLPKIKDTSKRRETYCRIINVSSNANYGGNLDFNDLEKCKVYASNKSYNDSKLAQVMHAKYLDKIMQTEETKINVYSLHPGVIPSDLWNTLGSCVRWIVDQLKFMFRTTENGADVVMYTALSPELEKKGGLFLSNCEIVQPNTLAEDVSVQKILWERSIELTKTSE